MNSKQEYEVEVALSNGLQVIEALKFLKNNEHYLAFRRFVIDPSLETMRKRIESNTKNLKEDKDGSLLKQILYDQGFVVALDKLTNFSKLEEQYKVGTINLQRTLQEHGKTQKG